MRVKVTITLDVDAQAWADEYGVEAEDVRRDVREHVASTVDAHLDALGLLRAPAEAR